MNKTKRCSKCGETLPVSEFHKRKSAKDGLKSHCRGCIKAYHEKNREKILESQKAYYEKNREEFLERRKEYREKNREKIRESDKAYHEKNREKILERQKAYREKNREELLERRKEYREKNREKIRESGKAYHEKNREKILQSKKEYHEKNREKILERQKAYHEKNREKIWERQKVYEKNRMATDPCYKMACNIRSLTLRAYKRGGWKKNSATQKILGCSFDEFKKHIESQFQEGMSWDNQGEWHYDHKIPLASAETKERITELSHYSNLQPLWADENLAKKDMMPEEWEKIKPKWEKARKHKPDQ